MPEELPLEAKHMQEFLKKFINEIMFQTIHLYGHTYFVFDPPQGGIQHWTTSN